MRQLTVSVNHPLAIGPMTRPIVRKPMEKFRNGTARCGFSYRCIRNTSVLARKAPPARPAIARKAREHRQIDAARFTKRSHRKDEARAIKQTAVSKVACESMRQRHADCIGSGIGSDEPGCFIEGRTYAAADVTQNQKGCGIRPVCRGGRQNEGNQSPTPLCMTKRD